MQVKKKKKNEMQDEETDLWENRNLDENSKKQISKKTTKREIHSTLSLAYG